MIYGIIDVGSNSVRLMISDEEKTITKFVKTTRLAEGMGEKKILQTVAIERTVAAVSYFLNKAKEANAECVNVFATAAVRNATNSDEFVDAVFNSCGLTVDVVSGEEEAKLGYVGALGGRDGAIIDVGGASTEITVVHGGKTKYSKSINVGAVVVTDECGQNQKIVEKFLLDKIDEFGVVPKSNFYSIGGTATSIASMLLELDVYRPDLVDGYVVQKEQVINIKNNLFSLSIEERQKLKGLQPERAKVIASGVAILVGIMEKFCIDKIIVSEKDNLEGYFNLKILGNNKNEQKNKFN